MVSMICLGWVQHCRTLNSGGCIVELSKHQSHGSDRLRVLGIQNKGGTANKPQSEFQGRDPEDGGWLPWPTPFQGEAGPGWPYRQPAQRFLLGRQSAFLCTSSKGGAGEPMTGCILPLFCGTTARHCAASDLNVSPWGGSWPTLPDTGPQHLSCRERPL